MPLFNWIPQIVGGLKEENMNLEPENEDKNYARRLTLQSQDKQKALIAAAVENMDNEEAKQNARLTSLEVDNIKEFHTNEIKNKPAQEVHQVFRRMFKDMKSNKLRKYLFSTVSTVVGQ